MNPISCYSELRYVIMKLRKALRMGTSRAKPMNPQRGGSDFRRLMLLALVLGLAAGLGTLALLVVLRCSTSWGEVPLPAPIRAFPFQGVIACPGLPGSANRGRWVASIVHNSRALNDQPLREALRL